MEICKSRLAGRSAFPLADDRIDGLELGKFGDPCFHLSNRRRGSVKGRSRGEFEKDIERTLILVREEAGLHQTCSRQGNAPGK